MIDKAREFEDGVMSPVMDLLQKVVKDRMFGYELKDYHFLMELKFN